LRKETTVKKGIKQYNTVEELLKDLEQLIDFLAYHFNIKGYDKQDLKQELYLLVLETWGNGNFKKQGLGFWFLRCKWHLLNLITKEKREPLSKAISLEKFLREQESDSE
jgi:hypothetical protein